MQKKVEQVRKRLKTWISPTKCSKSVNSRQSQTKNVYQFKKPRKYTKITKEKCNSQNGHKVLGAVKNTILSAENTWRSRENVQKNVRMRKKYEEKRIRLKQGAQKLKNVQNRANL